MVDDSRFGCCDPRRTQKPLSALWNVTRSTIPANGSRPKTKRAVEPMSAKQTAMTAFMHQRKSTQRE
jgi:hypothetical protein